MAMLLRMTLQLAVTADAFAVPSVAREAPPEGVPAEGVAPDDLGSIPKRR